MTHSPEALRPRGAGPPGRVRLLRGRARCYTYTDRYIYVYVYVCMYVYIYIYIYIYTSGPHSSVVRARAQEAEALDSSPAVCN